MEWYGYFASFAIGVSLGLIGGGGSILTMPVLVYLFGVHPLVATSYSLFIVGSTSLVGAVQNFRRGLVNFKTVFLFGITSVVTVWVTRKYVLPAIPSELFRIGSFTVTSDFMTMILFATLMIITATLMLRRQIAETKPNPTHHLFVLQLLGLGVVVGAVTGLLGAGGGFLLIPSLVVFVRLSVKEAIGTSLVIIAINSLVGFAGDLSGSILNWSLLFKITVIALAGVMTGGWLSRKITSSSIKRIFAWFVLAMGIYIFIKELILPFLLR